MIFHPVEEVEEIEGKSGEIKGLLLVCDHARNDIPPEIGDLGLSAEEMDRHIAWDVGARAVTLGLAEKLGAPAVLSTFSRLVIDPNRGEDDPTLVMKLCDGSIIPGNRRVDEAEIGRRLDAYYRPYHAAIRARLDAMTAVGRSPVIVSIHSFTPEFRERPPQPWHVGLLWDRDDRLMRPLMAELRKDPGLCVGDNVPYTGRLKGDCMFRHGTGRGLPHVLIEIRNDLISTETKRADWICRLAPMLACAAAGLQPAASCGPKTSSGKE